MKKLTVEMTTSMEWPNWTPISVRNGFAAIGLVETDSDYDGILD